MGMQKQQNVKYLGGTMNDFLMTNNVQKYEVVAVCFVIISLQQSAHCSGGGIMPHCHNQISKVRSRYVVHFMMEAILRFLESDNFLFNKIFWSNPRRWMKLYDLSFSPCVEACRGIGNGLSCTDIQRRPQQFPQYFCT